jgi:4-hydroxybenzoate polyprenyltransferase
MPPARSATSRTWSDSDRSRGAFVSTLVAAGVALRPRQWVKNLFVFAGLIFSQSLFTPLIWPALGAFVIFCALSGAIYVFNDLADVEKDRLHPTKRYRPIARGALSMRVAAGLGGLLLVGSLIAAYALSVRFGLVATAYAVLLTAYSVWLKHVVILDVLTVAAGFVLRAVAGAAAIGVEISGWLVICTILIALFLALGKRRHEYRTLKGDAAAHRPILAEYSEGFLDQMVAVVTASTVTAYALYTMSPETVGKFHTRLLPVTLPFVLYGIFRYLYLLYRREMGGNPSDLLLNDRALLVNSVLWTIALLVIIYGPEWGPAWLARWSR